MEILIKAGGNVNAQNQIANTTPLHCAIRGTFQSFRDNHVRRVRCVTLLLEAGADGSLRDNNGRDAFGCIEDTVREALMRDMGNIEEDMKDMRVALESAGLHASPLGRCIEEQDAEGVQQLFGGGDGKVAKGDHNIPQKELSQGLLAATNKFKLLVDGDSTNDGAFTPLSAIM